MSFAKVAPEFDRFLENFIHYELTKDEHPQAAAQSAATNDVSSIRNASTLTYFCVGVNCMDQESKRERGGQ